MAVRHAFDGFWRGRRVFVTGHNGFKGAWLALWLESLGAEVHGFALAAPAGVPNHHELLGLRHAQTIGDLRNPAALTAALQRFRPEIVFHLAAQPLARRAYLEPARTFETNVTGLVNLLDAIRVCPSVRALVSVTSHHGLDHRDGAFRGTMAAGTPGPDPYSASKACAELVVDSYRASFLSHDDGRGFPVDVATAHMSNVIGGGDRRLVSRLPALGPHRQPPGSAALRRRCISRRTGLGRERLTRRSSRHPGGPPARSECVRPDRPTARPHGPSASGP